MSRKPGFRVRRSLLFVPAVRPDRYPKALATGADAVCIDLEDGVSFAAKDEAREAALALFAGRAPVRAEVSLRINDPKTDLGQRDLDAVRRSGIRPDALMLPKCDGPEEIRDVAGALGGALSDLPLIVMVETARGVAAAEAIAAATPTVSAVFFGAIDFAGRRRVRGRLGRGPLRALAGGGRRRRRGRRRPRLAVHGRAGARGAGRREPPHAGGSASAARPPSTRRRCR